MRLHRLVVFQKKALAHPLSSEHLLRMDPVEDKEGFIIAYSVYNNRLNFPNESVGEDANNVIHFFGSKCYSEAQSMEWEGARAQELTPY